MFDENPLYVAWLYSAGGGAYATAPDENEWYVDLSHAAVGCAYAAAPEGIKWYVALLCAAYCSRKGPEKAQAYMCFYCQNF